MTYGTTDLFILMFSVMSTVSLHHVVNTVFYFIYHIIEQWHHEAEEYPGGKYCMLGTKTDLTNDEELKKKIEETPGEKVVEEGDVYL